MPFDFFKLRRGQWAGFMKYFTRDKGLADIMQLSRDFYFAGFLRVISET
jgi:hypothetical protein